MTVTVTQFMRPDGRQVKRELEISDEYKEKYEEILSCDARLTAERLIDGTVSQTIECGNFDFAFAITTGKDFNENKQALEKMILQFDRIKCIKQKEKYATS